MILAMHRSGTADNIRLGVWLDDLRLGIKAGLRAIEPLRVEAVGLEAFGPELAPRNLSQTGRRDLARVVRSKGANLSALKADVGGRRLADAKTLDASLLRLREAAQLASDVGAEHLVVAAGLLPLPQPPQRDTGQEDDAAARAALTEAARALCEIASRSRARICWSGGNEAPESLAGFLSSVDPEGILQLDLNPGAYMLRGIAPLVALRELAPRVALATAADFYRGGGEAPLGQGDVRWGELFIALSALPRPAHILAACGLEGDRVALLAASYNRLKALRRNPMG